MLAGFEVVMLFQNFNIQNSSEHTMCFNNMVGMQIMNLCKDGETIKITSQLCDILMVSVLLLLGLLLSCINYLTSTFTTNVFFFKLNIHVFLMKLNTLLKNEKDNSLHFFISTQIGGKGREDHTQEKYPDS